MMSVFQKTVYSSGFFVALCFIVGCGGGTDKKFIPATNAARTALGTALEHWKSGNKDGKVGFNVPIDFVDARMQAGKKLETYEILEEEKGDGPKVFNVKMKLDEDKEGKEVKYFIFGIDPLHVWSQPDYKQYTGS